MILGEYRGKRLFAGRLFAGRLFGRIEQPATSGGGIIGGIRPFPRPIVDALRNRRIEEDDLLLLLAACLDGNALIH